MANKINYGIKNVHYATYGTDSWNTPVAVPGAVRLGITVTGTPTKFYADDSAYVVFEVGSGYEGDLELALIPDSFATAVLGYEVDSVGGIIETDKTIAKPFCLLFEVEGDERNRRYAFYNVTATRPALNANTTTDSTDPDTQTLNITCTGREMTSGTGGSAITKNVVKIAIERDNSSATAYDAWFTTVYQPTFVAGA